MFEGEGYETNERTVGDDGVGRAGGGRCRVWRPEPVSRQAGGGGRGWEGTLETRDKEAGRRRRRCRAGGGEGGVRYKSSAVSGGGSGRERAGGWPAASDPRATGRASGRGNKGGERAVTRSVRTESARVGPDRTQTPNALRAAGALAEPDSTQTPGVAGAVGAQQTALGRGLDRTQTLDALRAVGALEEPDSTQTPGVAGAVGARSRQRSGGARQHSDTRRGRSGRRTEQTALGRG